ncbi:MAG TPA: roadblock/LC7 domain-containing protein [Longimicrobiaceae bacterium]|jgi:predicted regulator of Ras-like GTPase activity (Roadblock/LC7/MglB family)
MSQRSDSWSLQEDDARRIRELLDTFLVESLARSAMVVDRNGQLILGVGDPPGFDSTAFASLAAADFSANDQLASMMGEQEFSSLFHQGERESMYLADVGRRVILIALFGEGATLGMIRIKARAAVRELTAVFHELFDRSSSSSGAAQLESSWLDEAETEIDRLFGSL